MKNMFVNPAIFSGWDLLSMVGISIEDLDSHDVQGDLLLIKPGEQVYTRVMGDGDGDDIVVGKALVNRAALYIGKDIGLPAGMVFSLNDDGEDRLTVVKAVIDGTGKSSESAEVIVTRAEKFRIESDNLSFEDISGVEAVFDDDHTIKGMAESLIGAYNVRQAASEMIEVINDRLSAFEAEKEDAKEKDSDAQTELLQDIYIERQALCVAKMILKAVAGADEQSSADDPFQRMHKAVISMVDPAAQLSVCPSCGMRTMTVLPECACGGRFIKLIKEEL